MRRKKNKTGIIILCTLLVIMILLVAFTYGITKVLELPINLPFLQQDNVLSNDTSYYEGIGDTWYNLKIYQAREVQEVEELEDVVIDNITTEPDITTKFDDEVDLDSLENYIDGNISVIENGYDKLFIDEVRKDNMSVGIKTLAGHDVYALDQVDGIMIAGTVLENGCNVKIAFIDADTKLDLNVVDDLNYWEEIEISSKDANAILAVNASDYTWNYSYDCGKLKGLVKRHDDLIRKAIDEDLTVGITKDGQLVLGNVDEMYNGVEGTQLLIANGELLVDTDDTEEETVIETAEEATDGIDASVAERSARTLIGQLKNGKMILAVADIKGGGATVEELVNIIKEYDVENAALLSGSDRTIMYWNGKIVTNIEDEDGLKLPTTWIVKSGYVESQTTADEVEETEEQSQVDENALKLD